GRPGPRPDRAGPPHALGLAPGFPELPREGEPGRIVALADAGREDEHPPAGDLAYDAAPSSAGSALTLWRVSATSARSSANRTSAAAPTVPSPKASPPFSESSLRGLPSQ